MKALEGKVAVITGGSRGLGFGIAQAFLQEGAAVAIASRSPLNLEPAVKSLQAVSDQVIGLPYDVKAREQVEALARQTEEKFGKIDIWVNNAGTSCPTGPTIHVPPELFIELVHTNILGVYHGSQAAMRRFLPQGSGKLINIIGKGARKPVPLHNAYASSRAWVRQFTLTLAKEYRTTGVGAYLLHPGVVATDMLENVYFIEGYEHLLKVLRVVVRLLGQPPSIPAQKAVWLASSATDGRTGLEVSSMGPSVMLRGLGREIGRKLSGRQPPPFNPTVTLVPPAIDVVMPEQTSKLPGADTKSGRRKAQSKSGGYIVHLSERHLPQSIGNKAINLRRLSDKRFPVPDTYICCWEAQEACRQNAPAVLEGLAKELERIIDPARSYAIRSSADVEDGLERSFAGQFKTFLNVRGAESILGSIQEIWNSVQSSAVQTYLQTADQPAPPLRMAVLIQEMITPVFSGVAFSKNPITSLDEIVIEAVQGSGELLVQDGVTPLRWVNKWGNWIVQPENSAIPLEVIQQVAAQTASISKSTRRDVDLEWVYDGRDVYWVQLRDITALKQADIYSNKISKEMTPGMVKPLDWSVILPMPTAVWMNFISQVIGKNDIEPASLAKAFHYRAYHNLSVFGKIFETLGMPRESLEIMMGVAPPGIGKPPFKPGLKLIRRIPRIAGFLYDKWRFAARAEEEYPQLEAEARQYSLHPSESLCEQELLALIDRMADLNLRTTYNTVLSILLMQAYNGMLNSLLKKQGVDPQRFDLTESLDELKRYDPSSGLAVLHDLYEQLDDSLKGQILDSDYPSFLALDGIEEFRNKVQAFLLQFGHMSDRTGVFDTVPWRETPEIILHLAASYQRPAESTLSKVRFQDLKLNGMRGRLLTLFYRRARQFRLFREQYSSFYTYSLMLFRVYYLALADRFVKRGLLDEREDIYYLYDQEVRLCVAGQTSGQDFKGLVSQRKQEMGLAKDAVLPTIIYGETPPPLNTQSAQKLAGTPTSRGYYTGKAKVIRGLADFRKLDQGDVLVIPHSDIGWVPLFAKAGAVIAESGGMLSHSSIIAREYGIPAVVSVSGALTLQDDTLLSIDGYKGEIFIHQPGLEAV